MTVNGLSQEQKEKLTALMQQKMESGTTYGAALCIMQNGNEIYRQNFGYANKEDGVPIKNDTIYRLFSMTKPIISVAAHILIERGLLRYDDPVEKYIPSFADKKLLTVDGKPAFEGPKYGVLNEIPVQNQLLIRHLLNMTAGVYYPDAGACGELYGALQDKINDAFFSGKPYNTVQVADMLGALPLGFEPGTHWNYSTAADIMGAVVEIVSGRQLGTFLKDEIFTPLGMKDTGFMVPAEKASRYTVMYDWPNGDSDVLWPHEVSIFCVQDRTQVNPFESGGAGLVSTIDDYGRFATMLLNGGELNGKRILKTETVKMMTTPSIEAAAKDDLTWDSLQGYTYSNFLRILENPEKAGYNGTPGEYGWDGWTGNYFYCDPENKIVFMYFVQLCGGGDMPLMRELSKVIYSE